MDTIISGNMIEKTSLLKCAQLLSFITIFYNLAEGLVSILLGWDDETLSLFGFGVDSFVEVVSGIGILHMVVRLRHNPSENQDRFEQKALRFTGSSFYLLSFCLILTAVFNLYQKHRPETTFWGIVISSISIYTMWALIYFKRQVGKQLDSDAILADAECTKTCLVLSFVLLLASTGYEITGIAGLDAIGAIVIAIFSFREGREAFEKAQGKSCNCHN